MREKIYSLFTNPSDMTWEQILMNITLAAVLGFFIFISYLFIVFSIKSPVLGKY